MLGLFAQILAKVLDPIGLVVCFIVLYIAKEKNWGLPAAAICAALVTETFLTMTQATRDWGDGFMIGLFGGAIQGIGILWLMKLKARRNEAKRGETFKKMC